MGVVLSCLGIAGNSYKKSRDKKKASQIESNYIPSTSSPHDPAVLRDAQAGLQDEHLNTVPPPVLAPAEVSKKVSVEAPVPTATSSTPHANEGTSASGIGEARESDKMASDGDYMSFLDKANEDPGSGEVKAQEKKELKATDSGADVPAVLKKATKDAFYTSDADEPFVPVVLKLKGKGLPDEAAFKKLVNHPNPDAEVSILDIAEWDTQGQYKELVDAVREATKGSDIRVYRVEREGSRVEYWVVGVADGKLVGVKALAVES